MSNGKHGCRFSDDPSEWADYERSQMLMVMTRIVRLLKGTIDPHLARQPDDSFARMLADHVTAMHSTLEYDTRQPYNPPTSKRGAGRRRSTTV